MIKLTTLGNRKIFIIKDKIQAISESTKSSKNAGFLTEVYVVGSEEPFNVNESIEEVCKLIETP